MERKTAKIVSRNANFTPYVSISGKVRLDPFPYGVEIVEGEQRGIVYILDSKPTSPVGTYVVVEYDPADQFAEIVP